MGLEPLILAIMMTERLEHFTFKKVRIYASDIDESDRFGSIITKGIYTDVETKRILRDVFERYFKQNGSPDSFIIDGEISNRVSFQKYDLRTLEPIGGNFSLTLCKNVLLHLHPKERIELIRMFYNALVPGGYFVTEHIQKMPPELQYKFIQLADNVQIQK